MRISIDGNIGSGKSALMDALKEDGFVTYKEPVDEWKPLLYLMYSDPKRWSTTFNINALLSFAELPHPDTVALYERSPMSSFHVFAMMQHDMGYMTAQETAVVQKAYEQVSWIPDVIVYLRADPETSYERMMKRGRVAERYVSLDYISQVHDLYEKVMQGWESRVIVIDANRTPEEVYEEAKSMISMKLPHAALNG